ncbi:MAG TPA: M23 family metallopeptidase [Candidatus Limnocylindrales bacterium]|nr:M23 family metallopeptidase [Candidatus Limnocylindrales bacterium]
MITLPEDSPYLGRHSLTPLAERRGRHRSLRRHPRVLFVAVAALSFALAVPLLGAAIAPSASQLQPLAGGLAGAAEPSAPSAMGSTAPDRGSVTGGVVTRRPFLDTRLISTHPTDPDGPRTINRTIAPAVGTLTGYRWPISKGRVTLPFKAIPGGEWINDGKRFHDGVDVASFCGAPVTAAHTGVVLAAGRHFDDAIGWVGDLGPYYRRLDSKHTWKNLPIVVVIDDQNGYRSIYAHFQDVTVRPGQLVRAGQLIGHEGATGHASGCHVHYGLFSPLEKRTFGTRADIVRRMNLPTREIARVDPLLVLPGGAVALRTRNIAKAIAAAARTAAAPIAG